MFYLIFLCALSLVNANDCLFDDGHVDASNSFYRLAKPLLLFLPTMQKRLESCETLNPPYAQERLDKIELAMNKLQLSADKQIQSLLSWKSEVEAKQVHSDNESLVECHKEIRNKILQVQEKSDALAICESKKETLKTKLSEFQKIGSKYYHIEKQQRETWFGALHACHRLGSHLASPQNEEELDGLSDLLKTSGNDYWLDAHDHVNQNEYISVTTGEKAKYLKWNINEPNHARKDENCVELKPDLGKMNDRVCTEKIYFICEV
ncbi:mannose-binding protein-like [Drosophila tropicalis]|uniref:mannose-binding protein-like n=1 Tax=Drosophila tropicalis TaxID=46794 RepID=UPI0035AB790C